MVNGNNNGTRRISAKEEVIADSIDAIRKRIIQIQLESEFAIKFIDDNPEIGSEEAKAQLLNSIDVMKKEEVALLAKLNFYKEKRTELNVKRAMKGYNKFPATVNMEELIEVKEEK